MDKTFDALADFQKKEGLKPDGVCGPATLDRMKEVKKQFDFFIKFFYNIYRKLRKTTLNSDKLLRYLSKRGRCV